ncbi:MAG TPA: class I SAM-dependent methyltransferase [Ktedonobacterales bacterium]|nr:class I SAM-dependent methyltransferase [Ktedonobacterales bacterium]
MSQASDDQPASLPEHVRKNRALWDATSADYDHQHAAVLGGSLAMAWGLWRLPEADLRILGDVAGRDVLELGCGAARWSIALAQAGARPVGLDISSHQLALARRLMDEAGVAFPLIEASAESVPLPDASFDIIFCDWGAMTFCDPYRTVPEAARLLRPGGLLAFATATPLACLCEDRTANVWREQLLHPYFDLHRIGGDDREDEDDGEDAVEFQLPYGAWIRLFREQGFVVEDLIETRPPSNATTSYRDEAANAWASNWPMEQIWRVRKSTR